MECKVSFMAWLWSKWLVLIETLWNVKKGQLPETTVPCCVLIETLWNVKLHYLLQFPDLRINRNIMECKDRWPDISSSFIAVLIETLWNVKDGLYNGSVWCETVLIETLWNVKLERSRSTGTVGLGINRNIMECKVWIASVSMDALMY